MANTTSTLYSFVDEETNMLIAITSDTRILEEIAGGEESTISVEGLVILFDTAYVVSDIHINPLPQTAYFNPEEYEGLGLGDAIHYNILVRLMLNPRY